MPKEREALECLEFREPRDQSDQWALLVCLANLELVNLVQLATLESLASLACQEEMALLVQWVCPGQKVTQDLQAQAHQGNQVRMEPQVCPDLWVLKVHRVQLVSMAPLACQELARQVNQECQVEEEPLVVLEQLVRKESLVLLVLLVNQVLLVLLAQLVHRVQEDSRVRQALRDLKVILVWLVHQAQGEPKVSRELKVLLENQVPPVQ